MTLQARVIDVLAMPLVAGADVLHPDRVILAFGSGYSFDLGAFCYAKRSSPLRPRKDCDRPKSERLVDLTSFLPARLPELRRAMNYFSDQITSGGKRAATVFASARQYGAFLDWADGNEGGDLFRDAVALRQSFAGYVEHLRHKVATGSVTQNTAAVAPEQRAGGSQ